MLVLYDGTSICGTGTSREKVRVMSKKPTVNKKVVRTSTWTKHKISVIKRELGVTLNEAKGRHCLHLADAHAAGTIVIVYNQNVTCGCVDVSCQLLMRLWAM